MILDAIKRQSRQKRGGDRLRVTLTDVGDPGGLSPERMCQFFELVDRLGAERPRYAEVAKLLCLGGVRQVDVAEVLGVSRETAANDVRYVRARLLQGLGFGKAATR